MHLEETRAFVAVVEAGSFTEAGKRLGIPKSTLSRQVSRLEDRLGARLMNRTTRKLSLTDLGEAYFERCRPAIEAIADAERVALDLSGRPTGNLKVSMSIDVARDLMPDLLAEFRGCYPDVTLELIASQGRTDLVAEGFDVALRGGDLPDTGFIARKLMSGDLHLYASKEYLDAHGRPTTAADLADHDTVMLRPPPSVGSWRLFGVDGPVELPIDPWLVVNEFGLVQRAIRDGLGIGLLLGYMAQPDLDAGHLEPVLPALGITGGGLYAVYPSRQHLAPKVRVFVDFLVERLGG